MWFFVHALQTYLLQTTYDQFMSFTSLRSSVVLVPIGQYLGRPSIHNSPRYEAEMQQLYGKWQFPGYITCPVHSLGAEWWMDRTGVG